jgi:predicted acyl esterase
VAVLHQRIAIRDGVRLCTNIFRPEGFRRGPVLLIRTPYGKPNDLTGNFHYFG